jgi:hypothetical protein
LRAESDFALPESLVNREVLAAEALARKKASGILFAIAGIQLVCGGLVLAVAPQVLGLGAPEAVAVAVFMVALTVLVFAGLGWWARYQPLPAAVVGLVLYCGLLLLDIVVDPANLARGFILKAILIWMLIQAVQAGVRYNKLRRANEEEQFWSES